MAKNRQIDQQEVRNHIDHVIIRRKVKAVAATKAKVGGSSKQGQDKTRQEPPKGQATTARHHRTWSPDHSHARAISQVQARTSVRAVLPDPRSAGLGEEFLVRGLLR